MVNVISMTTVHGRFDLLHIHVTYQHLYRKWSKLLGINYNCVYVLSKYDAELLKIKRYLNERGFLYCISDKIKLSSKSQEGLNFIISHFEFDYLMHLDSDEFLSFDAFVSISDKMKLKCDFFRLSNKWITQWKLGKELSEIHKVNYDRIVTNAGACVSFKALLECNYILWTPGLSLGLNTNENLHLNQAGYLPEVIQTPGIYALEIKTGSDIHSIETMISQDILESGKPEDMKEIETNFPVIIRMVSERNELSISE